MSKVTFLNGHLPSFTRSIISASLLGMPSSSSIHIVSLRTCGTSSVTKYLNSLNSNLNCVSVKSDWHHSYCMVLHLRVLLLILESVPLTYSRTVVVSFTEHLQSVCIFIFVFLCNNICLTKNLIHIGILS